MEDRMSVLRHSTYSFSVMKRSSGLEEKVITSRASLRPSCCSSWMMISEKASIPMPTGIREIPLSSGTMSKVRRGRAETGSMPTVPISTPRAAAMKPLSRERVPSPAMMVMAMQMSAKISGGPI